ncbi:hypothetical protein [Streptomyces sp. TLI_171]|uniref:hypothetical protein n=1 Tax=Streptomyces sp. TLI_171 TaxID=1938859 RepID=UPI000C195DBB|nr:hypothetical protein [Streptomyces sp. TLI_171]RKE02910.1 hypothetical protein BX266_7513 [Streptomyces sp. TLI_171]
MTTHQAPPPTTRLREVADLTPADVHAVEAFLEERLDRVSGPAERGSDTYRVTLALRHVAVQQARLALSSLSRAAEANPADGHQRVLGRLVERWNLLMDLVAPWVDQPGWNAERWHYLPHPPERNAVVVADLDAQADATKWVRR